MLGVVLARKKHTYPARRLDLAREVIDAMLLIKPKMPAGHVWERLLDEYHVMASYSTVRKHVAERRPRPTQAGHQGSA